MIVVTCCIPKAARAGTRFPRKIASAPGRTPAAFADSTCIGLVASMVVVVALAAAALLTVLHLLLELLLIVCL